jgi:hypothetical protein
MENNGLLPHEKLQFFTQALIKGLFWRETHRLFPNSTPSQPRLFNSTSTFLSNLREHRGTLALKERSQHTCQICDSVRVVFAHTARRLLISAAALDARGEAVSKGVIRELNWAWSTNSSAVSGLPLGAQRENPPEL